MAQTSRSCILSLIGSHLSQKPLCVTGILPLQENHGLLVYRRGKNMSCVDLSQPSSSNILSLTQSCDASALDVERGETLHGSYLNAWKMDCDRFIPHLDFRASGLEDVVRRLREGSDVEEEIIFEPHKLNIYGASSFYKGGKSAPSSRTMFGTLVVVFPVKHEGGIMIIRNEDQEWTFDSASAISSQKQPSIAYMAFSHTAEHEILPVTYGYRISLTYNLFVRDTAPSPALSTFSSDISTLKAMLSSLIEDQKFLPNGGSLGFGLCYKYPIQFNTPSLACVENGLKGRDAMIKYACEKLGLRTKLCAVYKDESGGLDILVGGLVNFGGVQVESLRRTLTSIKFGGVVIREFGTEQLTDRRSSEIVRSMQMVWVAPLDNVCEFKTPYALWDDPPSLQYAKGNLCLRIIVGEPGNRKTLKSALHQTA